MTQNKLIIPYCTREWADEFFGSYLYDEYWADASPEKKSSAICAATDFIDLYCHFFDEEGKPFFFDPAEDDDFEDAINPRRLKQATAQEAAYLLSLDDNPTEPHPLTVLGLLRADSKQFSKEYVPPIFTVHVIKLLQSLGGEIDPDAYESDGVQTSFKKRI